MPCVFPGGTPYMVYTLPYCAQKGPFFALVDTMSFRYHEVVAFVAIASHSFTPPSTIVSGFPQLSYLVITSPSSLSCDHYKELVVYTACVLLATPTACCPVYHRQITHIHSFASAQTVLHAGATMGARARRTDGCLLGVRVIPVHPL